jgi:hypothetical protein
MAGLAATLAVQEGVQMHGGVGMTDDFDIGLFKRGRVLPRCSATPTITPTRWRASTATDISSRVPFRPSARQARKASWISGPLPSLEPFGKEKKPST